MPVREPLHVLIDPTPVRRGPSYDSLLSETTCDFPLTNDSSSDEFCHGTEELLPMCSALCLHNFSSNDADQLSFRRNEVLDIIEQREEGWWAAMRRGGSRIGWIPSDFVQPVSNKMGDKLRSMRESLRIFELEAEQLYSAPAVTHLPNVLESRSCSSSPASSPRTYYSQPVFGSHMEQCLYHDALTAKTVHSQQEKENNQRSASPGSTEVGSRGKRDVLVVDDKNTLGWISSYITTGVCKVEETTRYSNHPAIQDLPWYLRPKYFHELDLDDDGSVKFGTLEALVEKLIHNTTGSTAHEEGVFRNIFLATFRTFTTADVLFERLRLCYQLTAPNDMTPVEMEDWKEKWLGRAKRNVLTVFTSWLEDHQLLKEEPHIARRLTDFLKEISSPSSLVMTANLILQSIERLTFATGKPTASIEQSSPSKFKRRRLKNELLRLDAGEFAEQLALYEHKLYVNIRPAECLHSIKVPQLAPNITRFCADFLSSWVKWSILMEGMERRAHLIDFWIKTAEKCRTLNNYNSMFQIIMGLSSAVISRLHLTWNHVCRKFTWETLHAKNNPRGGFSGYRGLLQHAEGPCVPFILMFLTDMVHVHEQFTIATPPSTDLPYICFTQRRRYYQIISAIVKHQNHPYDIVENNAVQNFIHNHLLFCQTLSVQWFWEQGERVLRSEELVPKDIKKGLEAAGF